MDQRTALIVEDESLIATDMGNQLRAMGYLTIGPAFTGEEAVEIARKEMPDVVLMDISLAGEMDGIEAADLIKKQCNIPVIYITAFSSDSILKRARITGPYGYLVKPFMDTELKATMEMAFYKHGMEEELRLSREQYKSLLNASGAVPWEMDASTMAFTYIGPQSEKILSLPPEAMEDFQALGAMVHPEDLPALESAIKDAPGDTVDLEIEYRVKAKDGRTVWIRDSISSASMGKDGKMLRGFMLDITQRKEAAIERERYIAELKEALDKIKTLHGLLPICAWCKKIRNDKGYWQLVEEYAKEHFNTEFTHGICPDCKSDMEKEAGIGDDD